jgi:hypothetical protein
VAATIVLGIYGQPLLRLATDAATDVTNPTAYVDAVLGRGVMVTADVDGAPR